MHDARCSSQNGEASVRGARITGWRRIACALWDAPNDPQIFGALDVDAAPIRAFIATAKAAGHHITPTHLVGRAVAHALAMVPELNVQLRAGRVLPRESIDIFFIAAIAGGRDLSGVKVAGVDRSSAVEVARELADRAGRMKSGDDREFARTKRMMDALPLPLLRIALRASALLTQQLGRDLPSLGLRRHPFGSAMVSSVGSLGLPQGFTPLAWMYDVPVLVLVGELIEKPVADRGRVQAREVLPITATIDHRYADGSHIGRMMTAFTTYLATPEQFEPSLQLGAEASFNLSR
jgi:pyruvate dehydrogenase E2 component (dihydrolipoamide acetyltransferase)